ncbi:MAG: STAS domain-containing protein [Candidatus Thiodiazotropha sp. (ex Myrtea sp. 'scaly one' KF741663)]|nr:STAS domain-containing protein [Candidatus Thiodiazotropha sp. (ex Myrtea sp. 'scaly one' KF741663)]
MGYKIEEAAGFAIVHLEGDVDLSRSPTARQAILDCLQERQHVLVDLTAVTYIDSSGVASLVEGFQVSRRMSLDFALIGVSDAAMSVLQLARLDQVFPIFASLDARLAQADPKT